MLSPSAIDERYFYHCFPRRARDSGSEIEIGCKMLALMCNGLVLAPEIVKWEYPHADGTPPRRTEVQQRRVCFTELSPPELPRHAAEFGKFALEFRTDVLKGLGAIPVFYVPKVTQETGEIAALGSILVMQVIDAMVLAMRIAGVKRNLDAAPSITQGSTDCTFGFTETGHRTFTLDVAGTRKFIEAFTYALTPPDMLEHGLTGLLNFFYPADDTLHNKALAYYRQREWRIVGNLAVRGEELMRLPSTEFIEKLLEIDSDFFGREFPPSSGKRLVDGVFIYPGVGQTRILEMANRVIVPDQALDQATSIVRVLKNPPAVVSLAQATAERTM